MVTKQCRQCGDIKPLAQFRKYYGGRKGTYTICRTCEKINSRAKYLERKGSSITQIELVELEKIQRLYDAQRACGLQPPRREEGRKVQLADNLDELISSYAAKANSIEPLPTSIDIEATPPELLKWLTVELTKDPDYYFDEIYEKLKAKYRPVLRIDTASMLPVYDEAHAGVLERILDRFNKFEDAYYNEDET